MTTRTNRSVVLLGTVGALVLMMFSEPAPAEATRTEGRNVQHIVRFEPTDVDEDRALIAIEAVGVTLHNDGTVTDNRMWGFLDRVTDGGHDRGYFKRTWPDGSTTTERFESRPVTDESGSETFEGTFEYVSGTGRFEGIEGEGSFRGTAHADGMLVVDWEAVMEVAVE